MKTKTKTNTKTRTETHEAMRNVVEAFRKDLVDPNLLTEEGWDTSDIHLSDDDVASVFRAGGVKVTRRGFTITVERAQQMCKCIDAILSLRYMVSRGRLETDTESVPSLAN